MVTGVGEDGERSGGMSPVWLVMGRRWRLLVLFAVAGALVGGLLSLVFAPGYVTSARVLLQGQRDPDEVTTEAQLAQSSRVLGRVAESLGWPTSAATLAEQVTAAVADGNIIAISAEARTPGRAAELADSVAAEYVA